MSSINEYAVRYTEYLLEYDWSKTEFVEADSEIDALARFLEDYSGKDDPKDVPWERCPVPDTDDTTFTSIALEWSRTQPLIGRSELTFWNGDMLYGVDRVEQAYSPECPVCDSDRRVWSGSEFQRKIGRFVEITIPDWEACHDCGVRRNEDGEMNHDSDCVVPFIINFLTI